MASMQTRLIARQEVADRTFAFHFEKPADFVFKPGQAIDLALPSSGNDKLVHAFSLVAAPFEEELVIATRMRDSHYKQTLANLSIGTSVMLDGPFGSLTLSPTSKRPAVLVAGGIGITPFMSMVRQAGRDQSTRSLTLLYSNRRPEDTAFLAELQALAAHHSHFHLLATMTDMASSSEHWDGATGPIDAEKISTSMQGLDNPIVYLAGPPPMVEAMRNALADAGVEEDDIRDEGFFGY